MKPELLQNPLGLTLPERVNQEITYLRWALHLLGPRAFVNITEGLNRSIMRADIGLTAQDLQRRGEVI